ncbi:MAG: nickel-dependent lactate racemase [Spirochaetes bacterium]|nr:nickel-dependent lactate racemase [Spirochaetota bacterium]
MKIDLPWGASQIQVDLPDTWEVIIPQLKRYELSHKNKKEKDIVADALSRPVAAKALSKHSLKNKKVVIVVDDNTRPTPAYKFFDIVLEGLKKAGCNTKNNAIVIPALGIHTPMKQEEMEEKIGKKNLSQVQWENHNAFDKSKNAYVGTTSRGVEVYLNHHIKDADFVILIGLVEPHLWAGFGGGLKNILPGVAYAETIGHHHSIIAEPPYRFNRVAVDAEHNSFRLDLEETLNMIKAEIFCINVVLDSKKDIIACFAGHPIACHREAVAFTKTICGLPLQKLVDGVITNSAPMDINFKQSMKCVGNTLPALKPKGIVMGFLRAQRGLDDIPLPQKSTPLWLTRAILRTLGPARVLGFLEKVKPGLDVEQKFLTYYSMQLIRAHNLYFYVPSLSDAEVKALGFFERFNHPQEVIERGIQHLGKKATVAVFKEGGSTFPLLTSK